MIERAGVRNLTGSDEDSDIGGGVERVSIPKEGRPFPFGPNPNEAIPFGLIYFGRIAFGTIHFVTTPVWEE